MALVAALRA